MDMDTFRPSKGVSMIKNLVNKIMNYEEGQMNEDETISFFQELINSGMAWTLQGHYGRTATALIDAGYCTRKET